MERKVKASEVLLNAIMCDLPHTHKRRLMSIQGKQRAALTDEEQKQHPDAAEVARLKAKMATTFKEYRNVGVTIAEVVNPMREELGLAPLTDADLRRLGYSRATVVRSAVQDQPEASS